ncbi:voltage-gated potassium channel [Hartmannibacter diazotrophicus]|uniref:Voltage-gated potassium channel n=1 Tax=Hartmannibacter diazotrophicus TaxID=1482074 RepID=A0A2C9DDV5_9HYPH|nr:ion channel [Hartmannibacter diazotrophicus]SON57941.1 voltage-gated potassium channel [Hartmannibacter diazotrophicus]
MLANLVIGTLIISATVVIHTYGLMIVTHVMGWITSHWRPNERRSRVLAMNSVVIGIFSVLTVEVWLWAACYEFLGVVEDFPTALYFSTTTFTTVGYGDVLPHADWRLLAALEGVDGFLLIGWSTAYLIAAGMRVGPFRPGEHF